MNVKYNKNLPEIGTRFYSREFLGVIHSDKRGYLWRTKCECGNINDILPREILKSGRKCCLDCSRKKTTNTGVQK